MYLRTYVQFTRKAARHCEISRNLCEIHRCLAMSRNVSLYLAVSRCVSEISRMSRNVVSSPEHSSQPAQPTHKTSRQSSSATAAAAVVSTTTTARRAVAAAQQPTARSEHTVAASSSSAAVAAATAAASTTVRQLRSAAKAPSPLGFIRTDKIKARGYKKEAEPEIRI